MISMTEQLTVKNFHQERLSSDTKVGVINLGCARNLVDSQGILGQLKRKGYRIVNVENSDVAIVNTCAFIDEAKKESIDTILEMVALKRQGKLKKVIVAGCLAQRYGEELAKEIKGIDAIIGAQQLDKHVLGEQVSLTPMHYAYVKICESCYNRCSFCIIPKLKGKFVSRTIESVLDEVKALDARGVREINIIGQDITAYGVDLYHQKSLAVLLKRIVVVTKNIQWIRLLYTFPAHMTDELIDIIAQEKKICNYIDMPIQHISAHILKSQNRNMTTEETKALVDKIRKKIPQGSLRTTFIVGLPREGEKDFEQLVQFVKNVRFDKMGVFVYSREEGTEAYNMPGQVPELVKKRRLNILMKIQQGISQKIQQNFIGRTIKILIEEQSKNDQDMYLGRSEYDAPEVDGIVYVRSSRVLPSGSFVDVKITDAYEYDLAGDLA